MTLSRWLLATSVVLLVACSSDPSVNDEPEQQGTAVRMPLPVLSQAEQAACSGVGGTLTAALQLDGSTASSPTAAACRRAEPVERTRNVFAIGRKRCR